MINLMLRYWENILNAIFWLPEKYLEVYEVKSRRKAKLMFGRT